MMCVKITINIKKLSFPTWLGISSLWKRRFSQFDKPYP